ncbi:MAG TPA: hypothetical protein VMX97_01960, partial [Hyphomicrobiaceae bacterium]|nr:hypothetical protein [Hyphomicrobiaceae bacterium]
MSDTLHIHTIIDQAKPRVVIGPALLAILVAVFTATLIVAVAMVTGTLYHRVVYGVWGDVLSFGGVGGACALLYLLPQIYRDELKIESWLGRRRRRLGRVARGWLGTIVTLLVVAFLTKTGDAYSRAWAVLLFANGLAALVAFEVLLVAILRWAQRSGWITARRLLVIGSAAEIADFRRRHEDHDGIEIGAALEMMPGWTTGNDPADAHNAKAAIERAVSKSRSLNIADIVLLCDIANRGFITACIEAFSMMPVAVHLHGPKLFPGTGDAR